MTIQQNIIFVRTKSATHNNSCGKRISSNLLPDVKERIVQYCNVFAKKNRDTCSCTYCVHIHFISKYAVMNCSLEILDNEEQVPTWCIIYSYFIEISFFQAFI